MDDREIIRLLKRKRRRWKVMKATGTTEAVRMYKEEEKQCAKKIRNAKPKLERDLANNPDKNNRKFANVKSKTKIKTTIGPLKTGWKAADARYRNSRGTKQVLFNHVYLRTR